MKTMDQLVAYFSATGTTEAVAKQLAQALEADLYEIEPVQKYTNADLNWMDKKSRSSLEMNDAKSRPAIVKKPLDLDRYDTIYVGFPIWWYIAPRIIETFLESYDFSNKKIVLFATSGGSRFGKAVDELKKCVPSSTQITEGHILNDSYTKEQLKSFFE